MDRRTLSAAALFLAAAHGFAQDPPDQPRLDLRVVYAGEPGHPRTAEWNEFLAGAVANVRLVDVALLRTLEARDFDVIIVDTPPPFDDSGAFKARKVAELPPDWDHPTVALGYAAGMIFRNREIKLDWL